MNAGVLLRFLDSEITASFDTAAFRISSAKENTRADAAKRATVHSPARQQQSVNKKKKKLQSVTAKPGGGLCAGWGSITG